MYVSMLYMNQTEPGMFSLLNSLSDVARFLVFQEHINLEIVLI